MGTDELRKLVKTAPFQPFTLALSDGRSVVVRHPEQVVFAGRHVIIGLAIIERGRKKLTTPATGERFVKDWLLIDLIHVVSAEPDNGKPRTNGRRSRS